MKVLLQWTRKNPRPFEEIRSSDWPRICKQSKRPEPAGGEVIDDAPGYLHSLNVQGCGFGTPDHTHVRDVDSDTIEVVTWCDDDEDYPDGKKWGAVLEFKHLAPDPKFGGAWNTRHKITIYAQEDCVHWRDRNVRREGVTVRPWPEFVKPPEEETLHGKWVSTKLHEAHQAKQKQGGKHTWHEWTEGVPERYVVDGRVVVMRERGLYKKPRGTRTVFQRDTNLATGVHVVNHENELNDVAGTGQTEQSQTYGGGVSNLEYVYTSAAGFPNDAAWPTGDYRCQLDCSANEDIANFSYGLLSLNGGGAVGHFARVNTGLTSDSESKAQAEGAFTSTGLKLATTGSVSWSAGSASDRFECLVAVFRSTNHGNAMITMQFNSDGFADGPWTAPATVGIGQPRTLVIPPGARVQKQHPLSRECEAYWIPKRGVDLLATLPEVVDLTGHRHGAVGTGSLLVRGVTPRGPSIRFVDTGSFVQIPDHERLGGTPTGLTIACVFQGCEAVSGSIDGVLMQKDDPAATHHWALEITNTDGFGSFHMNTDSGGNEDVEDNVDISVNADTRTHVLMGTWDGANMRLYRDGLFAVGAAKTGTPSSSTNDIFLGRHADITNRGVLGHILLWVYWRRALTVDEARAFAADPTAMTRKDTFGGITSSTPVTSTNLLRFDQKKTVTQTLSLRYDQAAMLDITNLLRFDGTNLVTATGAIPFDLIIAVSQDGSILFDIIGTVEATSALRFDRAQAIEATRQLLYDALTSVQATSAIPFDILAGATATGLLRYDVKGPVEATNLLRLDLMLSIEATRQLLYDQDAPISSTNLLRLDTQNLITQTAALRYDAKGPVSSTNLLLFDTMNSVQATAALLFDLLLSATQTQLLRLDTALSIQATSALRYDAKGPVEATNLLRLDYGLGVTATSALLLDLLATATATRLLRFDSGESITQTASLRYDQQGPVTATSPLRFDFTTSTQATGTLRYDAVAQIDSTNLLRVDVVGPVSADGLVRLDLQAVVTADGQLRYDQRGTITQTLTLRYDQSSVAGIVADNTLLFDLTRAVVQTQLLRFDQSGGVGIGREFTVRVRGLTFIVTPKGHTFNVRRGG